MKKLIYIVFILISSATYAQGNFSFTGSVPGLKIQKVYLQYSPGTRETSLVKDSADVINNRYHFSGVVKNAGFGLISAKDLSKGIGVIIIAPEHFEVLHQGELTKLKVIGSQANADFERLKMLESSARKSIEGVTGELEKKILLKSSLENAYRGFILSNPASSMALFALGKFREQQPDPYILDALYKLLPPATQQSPQGISLAEKIRGEKLLLTQSTAGNQALEFILPDTSGRPVSLEEFKGKYVLLDFWASWCVPCRKDNPHLKSAYSRFHSYGFEIISISLDLPSAKTKWLQAIHQDGIGQWYHLLDATDQNQSVALQWGVHAIPQNFLINPEGKIITSGLREGRLEEELIKIFKP
ncbi:redoxin domain-containing protein [Pedobacter sp.]|uniref:redoxin domain-containing protein n=1 Tax=Pedobacter sp. TaxID=1411316 RepID=UPI003C4AA431